MEENRSLSKGNNNNNNRLKDYNNVLKSTNKAINITYRRSTIESGEESFGELSWPPKSYTCSFCKREFRSAQALGGHMNVHRREKAKLRQVNPQRYLSFLHPQSQLLDQNPNKKPNLNVITMPSVPYTYSCCVPLISDPCRRSHVLSLPNSAKPETRSHKSDVMVDWSHEKEGVIAKKSATGMLVEHKFDDLDLELRLGCS